jgi:hypothetical protein
MEAWVNFGHGLKAIWMVLICHGLAASVQRQINLGSFDSLFGVVSGVSCEGKKEFHTNFTTQCGHYAHN